MLCMAWDVSLHTLSRLIIDSLNNSLWSLTIEKLFSCKLAMSLTIRPLSVKEVLI